MKIQPQQGESKIAIFSNLKRQFDSLSDAQAILEPLARWYHQMRITLVSPQASLPSFNDGETAPSSANETATAYVPIEASSAIPDDIGAVLKEALQGGSGFTSWCASNRLSIDPRLAVLIESSGEQDSNRNEIEPSMAYFLGRVAMRDALAQPKGTRGLCLPYFLIESVDRNGFALRGADDELAEADMQTHALALSELERHLNAISRDPVLAISRFERERRIPMLEQWNSAVGVEQAINRHFRTLLCDWPLGRVIAAIARCKPAVAAKLIDALGHPAIQASAMFSMDGEVVLGLLPYFSPVFDNNNHWTRQTSARIFIDLFDSSCLDQYINRHREIQGDEAAGVELQKWLNQRISQLHQALLARPDGPRLSLEWISSLIDRLTIGVGFRQITSAKPDVRLLYTQSALSAAIDLFGVESWTSPLEVQRLLSSTDQETVDSETVQDESSLPAWINGRGERDSVMPLAVSAALLMAVEANAGRPFDSEVWLKRVILHFKNEPRLHILARGPQSVLCDLIGFAIARSKDPGGLVTDLWGAAADARLRSRFWRFQGDTEDLETCGAIVAVSISALLRIGRRDITPAIRALADKLQDMVDELRYCIPELGLHSWNNTVLSLAAGFALGGLLEDDNSCAAFLARFSGDEIALANAVVGAAANGVRPKALANGLRSLEVQPQELKNRWLTWNQNLFKDADLSSSPFLAQLSRLDTA